jgi:regulator of protease activity HflC (stomatin/prohibitin superfamily)
MFGINFIRFDATRYVIHYQSGSIRREGKGLAFTYFSPTSSIVSIPISSIDLPFIFRENTQDHQQVTIQGQITYQIDQPQLLAELMDFTVDTDQRYKSEDPQKLSQRVINEAQSVVASSVGSTGLRAMLKQAKPLEEILWAGLQDSEAISMLGLKILGVNILAIKPSPELARALEAEVRESLQQEADQAVYERRNFAVEQERMIKESELNTEIAVEEKQKQITQKKMETQLLKRENDRKLLLEKIQTEIEAEEKRQSFLELQSQNVRQKADDKAYSIQAQLEPFTELDWKSLMALQSQGEGNLHFALAFSELAAQASKIGQLNISPDLVASLMGNNQ